MGEVAASVGIVEAQGAAAAQAAAAAQPSLSFVDGDASADPAAAILDEVLAGTEPAAEPQKPAEAEEKTDPAKPAPEATPETPPNDIEAAKLRRGFAKLAEERQKVVELQNQARAARSAAESFASKAQKHDELVASIEKDPAAFLLAHGGEALVQKALQGFIDQEKSPAEREVAKLRQEQNDREAAREQREREQTAANWRNDIVAKVSADERFDLVNTLGLQRDVIDVITGYYEKHSERDDKGNVTKPAILSWDIAAQAVEDSRAAMLGKSKRYGKREPVSTEAQAPAKKDAPPAKPATALAKKAPTSLSSVPVAETPDLPDDLPTDDLDERERRILAEFGV